MKNSIKKILGIIIIIILTATCTVVAQTIIKSNEVTYDNSKSKGSFDNVQQSLDELYSKAGYTGEEYHEEILHGADPVLSGELIPVYLADNGDVYYANTHTKWYSYEYKKWANAVILVDDAYAKNRQDNKDKYFVGDKIDEEDIESYFVWIPRYAYKIWDLGKYEKTEEITFSNTDYATSPINILGRDRIIDITFGTNDYLSGSNYKKLIRNADATFRDPVGITIEEWLVHPAFTLGNTELNGFWIGKFETGYNQTNTGGSAITGTENWTTENALVTTGNSSRIVVKPNVFSWRNMNVSNIFNTAKGYNSELKSHMLKNTEWGAVAYLSHSSYGKGAKININNTEDYKTGYSALNSNEQIYPGATAPSTESSTASYNTPTGYLASTTGNITGVYDMAGGAGEYVASTMISGRTTDSRSGFTEEIVTAEMKAGYIDAYPADSDVSTYDKRILGDATGELGPFYEYFDGKENGWRIHSSWNANNSYFLDASFPWFTRGGTFDDGIRGGIFFFGRHVGSAYITHGFRLALAP